MKLILRGSYNSACPQLSQLWLSWSLTDQTGFSRSTLFTCTESIEYLDFLLLLRPTRVRSTSTRTIRRMLVKMTVRTPTLSDNLLFKAVTGRIFSWIFLVHNTSRLRIFPVSALKSQLSDSVGVLTVIFTSILLIVLVLVLLTLVGLRRRRRHSKYSTDSVEVNSVDLLQPVWSVKDHESHSSESERQDDLYTEPLNVSFIDLYQTAAADQHVSQTLCQLNHRTIQSNSSLFSSKDGGKDDSSGLGSSSASDSLCISAHVEGDTKSGRMYKETHFNRSSPSTPSPHFPPYPPLHSHLPHCPCPPQSVHTIDRAHSQAQQTPHTLFHCQHRCFHHPEVLPSH